MRFYFNVDENICADEEWVVNYLLENSRGSTREEILDGLHYCRCYNNWYECQVSNTISKKFI